MAFVPNRPAQNYQTANQSAYVGVSGGNMANEYLRYKDELDRQRREREEAERKAKAGWWKRALVNGVGGAIQGGMMGGIGGAAAGFGAGAGISALGDAAGVNGASYGMGGANLGGAAGMAYRRWAASRSPSGGGAMGGMGSAPSTPSLGDYQLSRPSYDPSSSFNFDTDIDYRSHYPGF